MTILSEKYLCVGEKIHILKSNEKCNNSMKNGHRASIFGPKVHLNGPHKVTGHFLNILFFCHSVGENPYVFPFLGVFSPTESQKNKIFKKGAVTL